MSRMSSVCAVAFAVSLAASGGAAVLAADPAPEARLPPQAPLPFQRYLEAPQRPGLRAFVCQPDTEPWGKTTHARRPRLAMPHGPAGLLRRALPVSRT